MVNKTWIKIESQSCIQDCCKCPYSQKECNEVDRFEDELWKENITLEIENLNSYNVNYQSFIFGTAFDE